MKRAIGFGQYFLGTCAVLVFTCCGCNKQEAAKKLDKAEKAAKETANAVSEKVSEAVEKGEKLASELSGKSAEYVTGLTEKFGKLDSLKESPAELKKAVGDLIQSIETKAEGVQLPEKFEAALTVIKEKLVALQQYLEGVSDPAEIGKRLTEIMDSVKSQLGVTGS